MIQNILVSPDEACSKPDKELKTGSTKMSTADTESKGPSVGKKKKKVRVVKRKSSKKKNEDPILLEGIDLEEKDSDEKESPQKNKKKRPPTAPGTKEMLE